MPSKEVNPISEGSSSESQDDLNSLLDSALEAMSAPKPVEEPVPSVQSKGPEWTEDFIKNATTQFEEMLRSYASNADPASGGSSNSQPNMTDFANIAMRLGEACATGVPAAAPKTQSSPVDANPMADTMRQLNEGAQALKDMSEEEMLAKMLEDLGFPPNADPSQNSAGLLGGLESMVPMMETFMKGLVSKDVLYPSMKEISGKYPTWLNNNKGSITPQEYENYEKQSKLMEQVCKEFESEVESESEEVKSQRFVRIMEIMQQIQACGTPPADLVGGDESAGDGALPQMNFDANQANAEQCNIM
ncbi:peroxisomal biogenesis factor 19-like [Artemia franciscana]|uniref:Peroxin-19 n=1 Tax=Artemia franciscana TaxID=6661 RepID=A0AA88KTL0_ARTSF|nr:hypothetical protein QYM36_016310 [Artemia franciscana]KAK2706228.1 hypothetical protein QYM36_016310 [Artemia franciscana]